MVNRVYTVFRMVLDCICNDDEMRVGNSPGKSYHMSSLPWVELQKRALTPQLAAGSFNAF